MVVLSLNAPAIEKWALEIGIAVEMPALGPIPPPPVIDAPRGEPPSGPLGMAGQSDRGNFSCGFAMQIPDGRRVVAATAHATGKMDGQLAGSLSDAGGAVVVRVASQLAYGIPVQNGELDTDFSLWEIEGEAPSESVLLADPRGLPQPGERVWLFNYARQTKDQGGWGGVVMDAKPHAVWIRFDESFDVNSNSGCPVVSQHTGKLIGMVIAGNDRQPVVMGLHPVGSLVEKAEAVMKDR